MCKCTWALNFRISDNVVSGVQTLQRLQSRTIVKRAGYADSRSASTRALARECVLLLENVFSYLGMCSLVLDMEILVVLLGHRLLHLVVGVRACLLQKRRGNIPFDVCVTRPKL